MARISPRRETSRRDHNPGTTGPRLAHSARPGPLSRFGEYRAIFVTIALFSAGICMGIAGAFVWAWAVRSGQFRDLEKTKEQIFWPDLADERPPAARPEDRPELRRRR